MATEGSWAGTAAELLEALAACADAKTQALRSWPKTVQHLSGALRRLAPTLREVGVAVKFHDQPELKSRRRQILIEKIDVSDRSQRSECSYEAADAAQRSPANDGPFRENAAFGPWEQRER